MANQLARLNLLRKRLLQASAGSPVPSSPTAPRIGEIRKAISTVLAETEQPMHVVRVHAAVERLLGREVNPRSVKSGLADGACGPNPRFKRLSRGYYSLRNIEG